MSLVNNMLRDLDQRRKGNAASPATVSLTPVSDARESQNFRLLMVLALVASVLAVSSALYYFQIAGQGAVTETINRRPELLSQAPVGNALAMEQSQRDIALESEEIPAPVTTSGISSESVIATTDAVSHVATEVAVNEATALSVNEPQALSVNEPQALSVSTRPPVVETPLTEPVPAPAIETRRVEPTDTLATQNLALTNSNDSRAVSAATTAPATGAGSAIVRNTTQPTAQERDTRNVQNALALFNSNQISAAFMMLSDYLQANGDAHQSRETYAKLLISQGVLAEANLITDEGLSIAPNRPGYKKVKARLLMADNQYTQAAALLINRAPFLTEDLEYHDLLATAQLAGRDYANAVNTYTNLIRQNNNEGKWWYGIAAAYDGLNDESSAIQAYTQALQSTKLSSALRQRSQHRITELRQ
ncbi:MAG: hypothetical protein WD772_05470 [Pseudohongiellaceae bacterium]